MWKNSTRVVLRNWLDLEKIAQVCCCFSSAVLHVYWYQVKQLLTSSRSCQKSSSKILIIESNFRELRISTSALNSMDVNRAICDFSKTSTDWNYIRPARFCLYCETFTTTIFVSSSHSCVYCGLTQHFWASKYSLTAANRISHKNLKFWNLLIFLSCIQPQRSDHMNYLYSPSSKQQQLRELSLFFFWCMSGIIFGTQRISNRKRESKRPAVLYVFTSVILYFFISRQSK